MLLSKGSVVSARRRQTIGLDQQIRFEPDPGNAGGFIRITLDGARGVMEGRTFIPTALWKQANKPIPIQLNLRIVCQMAMLLSTKGRA